MTDPGSSGLAGDSLRVSCQRNENVAVVALEGELDLSSAPRFSEEFTHVLSDSPGRIEIDIGGLTFTDSAGLLAVVRAHDTAHARGVGVGLTSVPHQIERVIIMAGLSDVLLPTK